MHASKACGATRRPPIPCSPMCWNWIWPASKRLSRVRAARRIAYCCSKAAAAFSEELKSFGVEGDAVAENRAVVVGKDFAIAHGDVVIAAITSCTNTSNPSVLVAAGLLARKCPGKRAENQALGQDVAGAGQPGGDRISRSRRAAGAAGRAGLQPGRLWLHHLHRQFRPAAGNDRDRDPGRRYDRRLGSVRQPQFRRVASTRIVKANYLASPPLVVAYALAGSMTIDITKEPLGTGKRRQAGLSERHLAERRRNSCHDRKASDARHVPRALRQRVPAARILAGNQKPTGETYAWNK